MKKKDLMAPDKGVHLQKMLRIMKLTTILLLIGVINIYAKGYSQDMPISVNIQNGTLTDLFSVIENNTDYKIFYKNSLVSDAENVNLIAKQKPVSELLDKALEGKNLSYDLVDKVIVITPMNIQQQQNTVTGQVTDQNNEPIPGVTVLEKGTQNGVTTDLKGNYSINVAGEESVLVFSFVGMETQEIPVGNQTQINVVMNETFANLDEVVVVGYGVQKKKLTTGANLNLTADDLKQQSTSEPLVAIQSQSPGVNITQSSGMPGEGFKVNIRGLGTIGNSAPLYVIDGVA
ncbi:MAG TPA: carboxypeptidase-like regulatory domain-containing protein, partial [Bacteroidales bacterium]|nr:carboxypeptidase-like regulatory domain-containing protein [Bacteroidales bacterium]